MATLAEHKQAMFRHRVDLMLGWLLLSCCGSTVEFFTQRSESSQEFAQAHDEGAVL